MRMALAATIATCSAVAFSLSALGNEIEAVVVPATPQPTTVAQRPQVAPNLPPTKASARQFVIKCELTRPADDGERKPLAAPNVVVTEGQEGTVAIESQQPFVTGVRSTDDGQSKPIVTTLNEGIVCSFTVTPLGNDRVLLDASGSVSTIDRVDEVKADGHTTQSPQLISDGWRVVRAVELGESVVVTNAVSGKQNSDDFVARVRIDRVGADEAAITPLSSAEASPSTDDESGTIYTVVYPVAHLLEPHARTKDKLEHADFLPIIDTVLSGAAVSWPKEAAIHPYLKNGSLVISQTKTGHEEIGRFLRDQRDNVAAIQQLIR